MEDTLDPPGKIAVVGGGPLGIEAALYGRYLGYAVTLYEAESLAERLRGDAERPAPRPCMSPLGLAAIAAQRGQGATMPELEPENVQQWVEQYLERLAHSDLLDGRVECQTRVERIELAPDETGEEAAVDEPSSETVEPAGADGDSEGADEGDEADDEDVPPDFLLHLVDGQGNRRVERFEAVLDTRRTDPVWLGPGDAPPDSPHAYLYRISDSLLATEDFASGLEWIRQTYARLWGRSSLNVYANLGG